MEKDRDLRFPVTLFVIFVFWLIGFLAFLWEMVWLEVIVGCLFLFWLFWSFKKIPADPPHKGVLVFLGRRQDVILNEGLVFLPCYPLFKTILINVEKKNLDLSPQQLTTPDNARIFVPVSITWTPADKTKNGKSCLINYLNAGKEKGVEDILTDIVKDRLRQWGRSNQEGPQTWEEAMAAGEEAVGILVKAILGEEIERIPSSVPTAILFKYFNQPPIPPSVKEKEIWGEKWEKVEEILARENKEEIERRIRERKQIIEKCRRGNGDFLKPDLGIIINRITIKDITISEKIAEAAEQEVIEKHQREAESTEIENVKNLIRQLAEQGFSREEAREIVQAERGKVEKLIREGKLNISPETRVFLKEVVNKLVEIFTKKPSN